MPELRQKYLIERRAGEIERLLVQGDALSADTAMMFDRIGVAPGWRCVDVGCGPRGVTDLLSTRVGPTGRVVGLDPDDVVLDYARNDANMRGVGNVDFVTGDVFQNGLPAGDFDLMHTRFVLSNIGHPDEFLAACARLTRPGGCVAFQEADFSTLNCYPSHPAWERLKRAFADILPNAAGNPHFAHGLYRLLRHAGFENVQYRPFLVGFRSSDPMADYLPATMESFRAALIEKGVSAGDVDADLAACRAHMAEPDTVSTYLTVVQVWGTKPAT